MKDRHIKAEDTSGYLPIISPVIHFISMTGVVFLRSSFGYVYLRPKSIFLSLGWAQFLFAIYVCLEPGMIERWGWGAIFGAVAFWLYVIHLGASVYRQVLRKGEHDRDSGRSHLMDLVPKNKKVPPAFIKMWAEPGLIFLISLILRSATNASWLSNWLILVSICLCFKEIVNYWCQLREEKRSKDMLGDTEEAVAESPIFSPPMILNVNTARKEKVVRARTKESLETKYGSILQLNWPFTLEQAERNYLALLKECPPDSQNGNERATELNQALDYFRQKA